MQLNVYYYDLESELMMRTAPAPLHKRERIIAKYDPDTVSTSLASPAHDVLHFAVEAAPPSVRHHDSAFRLYTRQ